ncbi:MAG: glycogen synthase GlgA [bacterium]
MKILFIASEMIPYAKTGGLADVIGSLPQELFGLGNDVRVIMPKYEIIDDKKIPLKLEIKNLEISLNKNTKKIDVFSFKDKKGVIIYFIACDEFYKRSELYGTKQGDYKDNDIRFILFNKAVMEVIQKINFSPDIYHSHDWQSSLIPVYLKTIYANNPFFANKKSVFTIHNLAYQGLFEKESFNNTGLEWELFTFDKLEYWNKFNFLKSGIIYADWITTVSSRYAKEFQTKEFGCGLEEVLSYRQNKISGIINGLDYEYWDAEKDTDIIQNYNVKTINKKLKNKLILQQENNLKVDKDIFLIGMITRLADQKGLDIISPIIEKIIEEGMQFVLLGTGEEKYHTLFEKLSQKYKSCIGVHLCFDAKMSKKIYAGVDAFLMPSYYEPCGLGQLISLRYGTVPIVRETGGLADTINEKNGFIFEEYSSGALLETIKNAHNVFKQNKKKWLEIVKNGMKQDFSWKKSAKEYEKLYAKLLYF